MKSPVNEGKVLSLFTIFAYILGGIGILVAWIPFVGILCIPAAILGIIFAIIGLVRDKTRGRSIGLPIGASILCVADIVIFVVITSVTVAGIAANTPTQTILNNPSYSDSPYLHIVTTQSTPIGTPLQAENAQVTVTAVTLGTVQLIGIDGTPETSTDNCIEILLTINDTSSTKIITYSTWRGDVLGQNPGSLMDDAGNQYRQINFGIGVKIQGQSEDNPSIYPGKTLQDVLVFERPVSAAKTLKLSLPGDNVNWNQDLTFVFPVPQQTQR